MHTWFQKNIVKVNKPKLQVIVKQSIRNTTQYGNANKRTLGKQDSVSTCIYFRPKIQNSKH